MQSYELIKILRKQLGITQEELARSLNVSFSTVNRWENGKNSLSKLAKYRLIEFFKSQNLDDEMLIKLEKL